MKLKDLKNQYLIEVEHKKEMTEKELELQEKRIAIMLSQIIPKHSSFAHTSHL